MGHASNPVKAADLERPRGELDKGRASTRRQSARTDRDSTRVKSAVTLLRRSKRIGNCAERTHP